MMLGTQAQHFHDFWISEPLEPRIYSLYSTKNTSNHIRTHIGLFLKNTNFADMDFTFCQIWKRRAPTNDEDPSKKLFKILNMRPIST